MAANGKTLYLTDMDGTLLNSKGEMSSFSRQGLNVLYAHGVMVSVATARSWSATELLDAVLFHAPLVLLGGARLYDGSAHRILFEQTLPPCAAARALALYRQRGLSPLLYTQDERDRQRLYYEESADEALKTYVAQQRARGDIRFCAVRDLSERFHEKLFYLTARGELNALRDLPERLRERDLYAHLYHGVRLKDTVCIETCAVPKRVGVEKLRAHTGATRIVAFGDNGNDAGLFEAAEEKCAVSNATRELKAMADTIIGSNDEDAVVKTILQREGLL